MNEKPKKIVLDFSLFNNVLQKTLSRSTTTTTTTSTVSKKQYPLQKLIKMINGRAKKNNKGST